LGNGYRAIILAAGRSKRLGQLTGALPKCLLSLGGTTILDHQIDNLRCNGISDITIVTGFCEQQIREACGDSCRYIRNPVFDKTNSIYSLWLGLQDRPERIVVLNSDVVFHPDILARLLGSPHRDALAISFQDGMGEEEMKVRVRQDRIRDIRKDMAPETADGENVGLVKFSGEGCRMLCDIVSGLVDQGTVNAWAPLAFRNLCLQRDLFAVSTGGLPWIEIDFPEDLTRAREEIYPRIRAAGPGQ